MSLPPSVQFNAQRVTSLNRRLDLRCDDAECIAGVSGNSSIMAGSVRLIAISIAIAAVNEALVLVGGSVERVLLPLPCGGESPNHTLTLVFNIFSFLFAKYAIKDSRTFERRRNAREAEVKGEHC